MQRDASVINYRLRNFPPSNLDFDRMLIAFGIDRFRVFDDENRFISFPSFLFFFFSLFYFAINGSSMQFEYSAKYYTRCFTQRGLIRVSQIEEDGIKFYGTKFLIFHKKYICSIERTIFFYCNLRKFIFDKINLRYRYYKFVKYSDRIQKIKYKSEKRIVRVITSNIINTDFKQVIKARRKKNKKECKIEHERVDSEQRCVLYQPLTSDVIKPKSFSEATDNSC